MTAAEFSAAVTRLPVLLFVISSMLAMGMSLTVPQIIQPLRNARLVALALLANFALAPLLAYAITSIIPLQQPLRIGLIVLSTGAGAPSLPKLAQIARGNIALGVGLMGLLMLVTIGYMPIVLPLLLPGVSVNPAEIARSLIVFMLIPLAIGLLTKSRSPAAAARWQPVMDKIANLAILVLLVVALGLNVSSFVSLLGTVGIPALLLFIAGCLAIGYVLGGRDAEARRVMGLGTAQRDVSAAVLVSTQNFSGTMTLPFVLVGGLLLLLILLPMAWRMGAAGRAPAVAPAE